MKDLILVFVFFVLFIATGCSKTNSQTVTEIVTTSSGDNVSSTSSTSTTTTNTNSYTFENLTQLTTFATNLVNITSSVWSVISAISSSKVVYSEEVVKSFSNEIIILVYKKYGKFPSVEDVVEYVKLGKKPSEVALQNFADTGRLIE